MAYHKGSSLLMRAARPLTLHLFDRKQEAQEERLVRVVERRSGRDRFGVLGNQGTQSLLVCASE